MDRRFQSVFLWLCAAAIPPAAAASQRYFPLEVGNQWVLETPGPTRQILNIEVLRSRLYNETPYYLITGYAPTDVWLRVTREGVVYSYDPATNKETKQAHTALNATPYSSSLSGCSQGVTPAESISIPGVTPPVQLNYAQGGCRGFHFRQENYRWDVGLSLRTVADGSGNTLTFRLVYAKVNGRAVTGDDGTLVLLSDFNLGARGWLAGFSDYTPGGEDGEMSAEIAVLPEEIDDTRAGFRLQSRNGSSGYFMFLKRRLGKIEGVAPNQEYELTFDIAIDSEAPAGCSYHGLAAGDLVYLKAGVAVAEPVPAPDEGGALRMNVDKGDGGEGGADVGVVDDIDSGRECREKLRSPFVRLRRTYTHPQAVRTGEDGMLWLIAGTDSAAEGLTTVYYESIVVRLKPVR
jgi:hypothetical protein